jgi:hypothetical protein
MVNVYAPMAPRQKLRACDVLNWEYLVQISQKSEHKPTDAPNAIANFAYEFTSTADEDIRDKMFLDILNNGTKTKSRGTAEAFVESLAGYLKSDYTKVRAFAKENGVRLAWSLPKLLRPSSGNP